MKRLLGAVIWAGLVVAVPAGFAQEGESAKEASAGGHEEMWKWANFLVLAGIIGYFVGKNGGPFFAARSRQIRKDLIEAAEVRKDAEARAADVDRRLAHLEADIAGLRAESQREAQEEMERIRQRTVGEVAKIEANAGQEIASAGKAARMELKRYAAKLAIGLAEHKIRDRMTPQVQDELAGDFVRELEEPASKALIN
jgi:F-type H+-transporting ATPase subunit b